MTLIVFNYAEVTDSDKRDLMLKETFYFLFRNLMWRSVGWAMAEQ